MRLNSFSLMRLGTIALACAIGTNQISRAQDNGYQRSGDGTYQSPYIATWTDPEGNQITVKYGATSTKLVTEAVINGFAVKTTETSLRARNSKKVVRPDGEVDIEPTIEYRDESEVKQIDDNEPYFVDIVVFDSFLSDPALGVHHLNKVTVWEDFGNRIESVSGDLISRTKELLLSPPRDVEVTEGFDFDAIYSVPDDDEYDEPYLSSAVGVIYWWEKVSPDLEWTWDIVQHETPVEVDDSEYTQFMVTVERFVDDPLSFREQLPSFRMVYDYHDPSEPGNEEDSGSGSNGGSEGEEGNSGGGGYGGNGESDF